MTFKINKKVLSEHVVISTAACRSVHTAADSMCEYESRQADGVEGRQAGGRQGQGLSTGPGRVYPGVPSLYSRALVSMLRPLTFLVFNTQELNLEQ